ncbi:MAG: hypothetical protein KC996_02295 [Phycisphaerales bacterium]|nr:hypothetical protein [Phycisphaerales bacterium]
MLDTLAAGDNIKLTITRVPNNKSACDTIERMMRRDPEIKRNLKRAQQLRARRMHSYIRGGRMWYSREKAARVARCENGNAWTMAFTHDIRPDLASVEKYLSFEKA